MVFGNMNKDAGISNAAAGGKKRSSPEISDYFSKRGQPPFSGKDRVRQLPQIPSTSVVQATVSREGTSPPIQQRVEYLSASQPLSFRITEPFQPANFRFPKKLCGKQNS